MESAISADLHPLALEDVLHQRGHARSKADYYPQHLFIRVLIHTLATDDDAASSISHLPRSESPSNIGDDDDDDGSDRKRKFKRELGAEGFLDELDFEESFADDEEKMEVDDKEDEEAKELEVCHAIRSIPGTHHLTPWLQGTAEERVQERKQATGGLH